MKEHTKQNCGPSAKRDTMQLCKTLTSISPVIGTSNVNRKFKIEFLSEFQKVEGILADLTNFKI